VIYTGTNREISLAREMLETTREMGFNFALSDMIQLLAEAEVGLDGLREVHAAGEGAEAEAGDGQEGEAESEGEDQEPQDDSKEDDDNDSDSSVSSWGSD